LPGWKDAALNALAVGARAECETGRVADYAVAIRNSLVELSKPQALNTVMTLTAKVWRDGADSYYYPQYALNPHRLLVNAHTKYISLSFPSVPFTEFSFA
jgi:hypothetical protein